MKWLSLGDSIASGEASFAALASEHVDMEFINLAQGGATVPDLMIEQMPKAIKEIVDGDIGLVTVVIGANDVQGPVNLLIEDMKAGKLADETIAEKIVWLADTIRRRLDAVLSILDTLVEEGVPIYVLNYYNPYPCGDEMWGFAEYLVKLSDVSLNNLITRVAHENGADVLDISDKINSEDVVGDQTVVMDDGEEWTFYDIHPSEQGHAKIARHLVEELSLYGLAA